ncbi:hypothetical protein SRHO_G00029650 [Serrasalmus rhombeus]
MLGKTRRTDLEESEKERRYSDMHTALELAPGDAECPGWDDTGSCQNFLSPSFFHTLFWSRGWLKVE